MYLYCLSLVTLWHILTFTFFFIIWSSSWISFLHFLFFVNAVSSFLPIKCLICFIHQWSWCVVDMKYIIVINIFFILALSSFGWLCEFDFSTPLYFWLYSLWLNNLTCPHTIPSLHCSPRFFLPSICFTWLAICWLCLYYANFQATGSETFLQSYGVSFTSLANFQMI